MPRFYAHHRTRPREPQLKRADADSRRTTPAATPNAMLQLQRTIGNHGVRALLAQNTPPLVQRPGPSDNQDGPSGGWLNKAMHFLGMMFGGGEKSDQPKSNQEQAKRNVIRNSGGVEFYDIKTRKKVKIDDKNVMKSTF